MTTSSSYAAQSCGRILCTAGCWVRQFSRSNTVEACCWADRFPIPTSGAESCKAELLSTGTGLLRTIYATAAGLWPFPVTTRVTERWARLLDCLDSMLRAHLRAHSAKYSRCRAGSSKGQPYRLHGTSSLFASSSIPPPTVHCPLPSAIPEADESSAGRRLMT